MSGQKTVNFLSKNVQYVFFPASKYVNISGFLSTLLLVVCIKGFGKCLETRDDICHNFLIQSCRRQSDEVIMKTSFSCSPTVIVFFFVSGWGLSVTFSVSLTQERSDVLLTTPTPGRFISFVPAEQTMIWGSSWLLILNNNTHISASPTFHSRCPSAKESTSLPHRTWAEKCVCACVLGCMTVSECFRAEVRGCGLNSFSERHISTWLTTTFASTTAKHHG